MSQVAEQPLTVTVGTGGAAVTTHHRYDIYGNQTQSWDALSNVTETSFNLYNQPTSVIYPATGQTGQGHGHLDYTCMFPGAPVKQTDLFDEGNNTGAVRTVVNSYGAEGELLSVSGSAEPVSYTYDAGYRAVADVDGRPLLMLRVDAPRSVFLQGRSSLNYLMVSLFVAALVFAGVAFGVVLLGERVSPVFGVGALLVGAGIVLVNAPRVKA